MQPHIRAESGFALPFTIFLITLITIMLAAAFSRTAIEFEIASSSDATVTSAEVAKSGLRAYLSDTLTLRPTAGDSFRYNVVGGYAWVVPTLLQQPSDTLNAFDYIIRSTGYLIEPSLGSEPQATRTVAQFASWNQGQIRAPAAYTTLNGVGQDYSDFAVAIDGIDGCGIRDVIGYRGPHWSHGGNALSGTIYGSPQPTMYANSPSELASQDIAGIDWALIASGGISPDYPNVINGDTTFATYVIVGDYDVPDGLTGTGLLIVTGDLDTGNTLFDWEGLILIGERFDFDALNTTVRGMVVSGLATEPGGPYFAPNDMDDDGSNTNHTFTLRYDSCSVAKALKRFRGFSIQGNAQVDNWATY